MLVYNRQERKILEDLSAPLQRAVLEQVGLQATKELPMLQVRSTRAEAETQMIPSHAKCDG